MTPRLILTLTLLACASGCAVTSPLTSDGNSIAANDRVATSRAYLGSRNLGADGVAISGYSPVSYFRGKAERGSELFAAAYDGVTYHLTDASQLDEFERDPERYVPAFGGWCAFGMAISDKFPVDPTRFKVVDGRLYLFLRNDRLDALELWNDGDEAELKRKAAAHWTRVQG
jgi:hypothetical protein